MNGAWIFDPTISLGTVIQLATMLITVAVVWAKLAAKLGALETKVDALWDYFTKRMERRDSPR